MVEVDISRVSFKRIPKKDCPNYKTHDVLVDGKHGSGYSVDIGDKPFDRVALNYGHTPVANWIGGFNDKTEEKLKRAFLAHWSGKFDPELLNIKGAEFTMIQYQQKFEGVRCLVEFENNLHNTTQVEGVIRINEAYAVMEVVVRIEGENVRGITPLDTYTLPSEAYKNA